ncbi:hypothetical protein F4778DRAFT_762587 [Xylariomycetidae sp. FL2044]|nr:hypothetical protein F4778DRAFT_762587 [Xylariomycetidae sp. FL2044]
MTDAESSDLSSIVSSLSPAPSGDDGEVQLKKEKGILKFFHKLPPGVKPAAPETESSPPPRKRSPSPAHDYVLADNPDIAFIVMFRSRFNETLPKSLANFGPQEIERGITEAIPGDRVEHYLCAILGLLLNRKQDVKPGHYNRALEDAISSHKNQWAKDWEDKSPLSGGKTFTSMTPTERLTLLKTLTLWALSSSEAVKRVINDSYKGQRREDDITQPLSVQPWGSDSDKRRYYLIEGLDDTNFRVYRESNPAAINKRTWWSVAGNIEELNALADKLLIKDGGPKARKLAQQMLAAVPRFEATEEKRRRREYRLQQKERFKRPEPGYSTYEGRTRGKRMKYTYSDDEEDFQSESTTRRSTRNTRNHTPAEPTGPVTTASGRQIKAPSRMTVDASNNIVTTSPTQDQLSDTKEPSVGPSGRPRRSAAVNHGTNGWTQKPRGKGSDSVDDEEEDDDDDSEPDLGDDEEEDDHIPDADSEDEEDDFDEDQDMVDEIDVDDSPKSMIVKMKIPSKLNSSPEPSDTNNSGSIDLGKFKYNAAKESLKASASPPVKDDTPEDVISVAVKKRKTPEPSDTNGDQPERHPSTPAVSALQAKSLAFRESPDKSAQAPPKSVNGAGSAK